MIEYSDGYAMQINWQSEQIKTENYDRGFCMSYGGKGANCWLAEIPNGRDSLTETASYEMEQADFDKIYNSSFLVEPLASFTFGTRKVTQMPNGWDGTWEHTAL
jgi:hypothetical protein